MRKRSAGYSLVEAMVVIALLGIASGVAIIQLRASIKYIDADIAANTVQSQMLYARQIAIDQRRNVDIGFTTPNQIRVERHEPDGSETVMSTATLPSGYSFGLPTGVPGDTPDAFGNGAAVYIGGGTSGTFLGDGTFVNSSNVLLNGTVFTINSGNPTSRATTISSTGRIKQYWLQGTTWKLR